MIGFLIYLAKVLAFVIMLPIVALGGCLLWDKHKRSEYYAERPILLAMHGKGGSRDRRDIVVEARAAILQALPVGTSLSAFDAAFTKEGFRCVPPSSGQPPSVGRVCWIEENPGAIYFMEASWTVFAELDDEKRLADVRVELGK